MGRGSADARICLCMCHPLARPLPRARRRHVATRHATPPRRAAADQRGAAARGHREAVGRRAAGGGLPGLRRARRVAGRAVPRHRAARRRDHALPSHRPSSEARLARDRGGRRARSTIGNRQSAIGDSQGPAPRGVAESGAHLDHAQGRRDGRADLRGRRPSPSPQRPRRPRQHRAARLQLPRPLGERGHARRRGLRAHRHPGPRGRRVAQQVLRRAPRHAALLARRGRGPAPAGPGARRGRQARRAAPPRPGDSRCPRGLGSGADPQRLRLPAWHGPRAEA